MLFSHKVIDPMGVAGLNGNELTVTVNESDVRLLPQELNPIRLILAVPI